MSKAEIRKAVKAIWKDAKIKWFYDLAQITNWKELDGGKYAARYTGKNDFYDVLRSHDLIGHVTHGTAE